MECWSRKTTDRKEERVERREGKKNGRKLWAIKLQGCRGGAFQTQ